MKAQRSRTMGFTLIEILIVVAITALLAALLFPTFARIRERGRSASCASNLRQIGLGFLQYVQDHDGKIPSGNGGTAESPTGTGWAGSLYSYVKDVNPFRCPSDGSSGTVSFAYNMALHGEGRKLKYLTRFRNPTKTVLLLEISTGTTFDLTNVSENVSPVASGLGDPGSLTDGQYATGYLAGIQSTSDFMAPEGRHGPKANYLFADGHVKALSGANVSPGLVAGAPNNYPSPPSAAGTGNPNFLATFSPV